VQTLKTAIVVLLMMTVMYGCYVSLTTSLEPLPDNIVDLIEESGSFGDFAIDSGVPESLVDVAGENAGPSGRGDATFGPTELSFSDDSAASLPPASAGSGKPRTGTPAAMVSLSDQGQSVAQQLPKPSDASSVVMPDPNRNYPQTQSPGVNLPDPRSLDALPSSGWDPERQFADSASSTGISPSKTDQDAGIRRNPYSELPDMDQDDEPAAGNVGLANAIRTADRQFAADQPAEALATLSLFYNTPDMNEAERSALLGRLDPLAATVIYSRRHLLEQPHRVGQAETLMEIAARYELPWQLLANINSIDDPVTVLPGTELKVVRGPFRAEVDLKRQELTIFLGDLYAGRFPIAVGSAPAPEVGTYTIQDKQSARTYYDAAGTPIPPDDPRNPYGKVWLDLGKQICIHGSPDRTAPTDQGCISLRGTDADDLYAILGQGSTVTIRR
jgi:lipoprotein-anchoring transpeptidase ErfK/SrfK